MKKLIALMALAFASVSLAQTTQPSNYQLAQQRLEERTAARKAAATQPTVLTQAQVDQLLAENAQLKAEIALLKQQLAALGVPPSTTSPNTPSPTTPTATTPTSTTTTDRETYVGPRGGVYHYSKSGKKVYEKHK